MQPQKTSPFILLAISLVIADPVIPGTYENRDVSSIWRLTTQLLSLTRSIIAPPYSDPQLRQTAVETIRYFDYPVEVHKVTTEDGYILELHRIPHGSQGYGSPRKPPILVVHSVLCSSHEFVSNFPHNSLGFILADNGFDVWLGNLRGNTYSKKHVRLSPISKAFWQFSIDEVCDYDIPAMIDYVLYQTGYPQLTFLGYSMGSTGLFGLLATKPEYNDKVKSHFCLSPEVVFGDGPSPTFPILRLAETFRPLLETLGMHEMLPAGIGTDFCILAPDVCAQMLQISDGYDSYNLNVTRMPVYVSHLPAGTSLLTLIHRAQISRNRRFKRFDYGLKENQRRYNQAEPPEYDFSKISVPTAIIWSLNDFVVVPSDVRRIVRLLGRNVFLNYQIPFKKWNHIDYVNAIHADEILYNDLVRWLLERQ